MFKISALLAAVFVLCDSASLLERVNKKEKCSIKDDECMKSLYGSFLIESINNGIPDMDIPKLDPLEVKYMNIQALGLLNVTITDGVVKGLKNCFCASYKNDLEARRTAIEMICDVFNIEGHYQFEPTPTLLALTGGINVHGKGLGSAVIEKLKINLNVAYEVKRQADCELHFELQPEESSYTFDVLGKVMAKGGNVYVGKQDISVVTENIFNENWKTFIKAFGREYSDRAHNLFLEIAQKIFDHLPIKHFVTEDLSAYVR